MTYLNKPIKHNIPDNAFWKFSYTIYQQARVKAACLYLQNHYNLNVNMTLFCIWFAKSGRGSLDLKQLRHIMAILEPWQNKITKEIRALRKKLAALNESEEIQSLQQDIALLELHSEKIQQNILYHLAIDSPKIHHHAKCTKNGIINITNYYSLTTPMLDEQAYVYTRHLLADAFSDFQEEDFPQMRMELG